MFIAEIPEQRRSEIESFPVDTVGKDGHFEFSQTGLTPLDETAANTWEVKVVHARGAACTEITLPNDVAENKVIENVEDNAVVTTSPSTSQPTTDASEVESETVSVDWIQYYQGTDGQVVPADALHPAGSDVLSRWYYVGKDGVVEQGLVFTSDANNRTYQRTVLQGNEWINMTLKEHGFVEDMYTTPAASNQIRSYFSVQEAIQFLEVALLTESSAGAVNVNAYEENGRFHLTINTTFATPLDLGSLIPEPVIAGERHFVFDGMNGHLLTDTHNFTLQSGETFLAGIAEYHTSLLLPQLPDNVQQVLDEAQKVLEVENK